MNNKELWMWLCSIEGIWDEKIKAMLDVFKTPAMIYKASETTLAEVSKLVGDDIKNILISKEQLDITKIKRDLEERNIKFFCRDDKEYPHKLLKYEKAPYGLYVMGNLPDMNKKSVAVIGARACSNYGRNTAKKLGRELSDAGIQVISGMARGIDTYSQIGALEGATPTFSVLGSGVDVCYPTENIELYDAIIKSGGGIISEYPPGSKPLAWHFPMRNRIISGMADCIAVIEAKEKSGSLITVEWALEQGKDVFAVPGRVDDSLSSGCNRLIKNGAQVITSVDDILEEIGIQQKSLGKIHGLTEKSLEKDLLLVYSELSLHPKSVHTLIEETRFKYEKIIEILLELQLVGLIEEVSKNYYAVVN